jgi:hypothetical protein
MTLPKKHFASITLRELRTPTDGSLVMTDMWWVTDENGDALFFKGCSPQCNKNPETAKRIGAGYDGGTGIIFLPVAYIPRRHQDRERS